MTNGRIPGGFVSGNWKFLRSLAKESFTFSNSINCIIKGSIIIQVICFPFFILEGYRSKNRSDGFATPVKRKNAPVLGNNDTQEIKIPMQRPWFLRNWKKCLPLQTSIEASDSPAVNKSRIPLCHDLISFIPVNTLIKAKQT